MNKEPVFSRWKRREWGRMEVGSGLEDLMRIDVHVGGRLSAGLLETCSLERESCGVERNLGSSCHAIDLMGRAKRLHESRKGALGGSRVAYPFIQLLPLSKVYQKHQLQLPSPDPSLHFQRKTRLRSFRATRCSRQSGHNVPELRA
jgi:hypothetical protein